MGMAPLVRVIERVRIAGRRSPRWLAVTVLYVVVPGRGRRGRIRQVGRDVPADRQERRAA